MYSVPGTDIVFACIMCALLIALAFIVGKLHGHIKLKEERVQLLRDKEGLCADYNELMEAFHGERARWDYASDSWPQQQAYALLQQKRELTKKHREAMKKYRTKCDAKLVTYIDRTYQAQLALLRLDEANHQAPDFSLLLSK
jgi:hypothetical protein